MFNFLKSKKEIIEKPSKQNWLSRLNTGLKRTRNQLSDSLANLFLGKKTIDNKIFEELETLLLLADVGVAASQKILNHLTDKVARKELNNPEALIAALKQELRDMLVPFGQPIQITAKPYIILTVGVNGVGKTTSIAKIAYYYKNQGKKIMLAAGDTFRAAGVEQLQIWGERNHVPVIAQQTGADSASVIYDALHSAAARHIDVLIADTAGRLHTQDHLMAELQKIIRVIKKFNQDAPHETMLVVDAGTGQNALNQAEQFHKAVGLTGITLTKLDGTAKGGIIFAITEKMHLPIRFIGVGEQMDDLKPFNVDEFIEALFVSE